MPIDAPPQVFETHVSTIFLVGDRAYKLKKPVKTGFLDYSTREARLSACRQEIDVNRRFAPDVYLGVADIAGPDGIMCDHLVVMKRMPKDRRLSNLVREGLVGKNEIVRLARDIAQIHQVAPRSSLVSRDGTRDALRRGWETNFRELRPYAGSYLDEEQLEFAELLAGRYLAGRNPLFESRIAEGRVVNGHGDLLADDIYLLDDGPRILDALEFDEHLRHVDVLDDVAFLAMDLERLGAPELSKALLDAYIKGNRDPAPRSLADHYVAYRALVRAKVACLRADQGDTEAAVQAYLLERLAAEHLVAARVMLLIVGGLPGSGKSTLSNALAETCGCKVLNSDVVRKELAGISSTTPVPTAYRTGIYSREFTRRTYHEMLNRARDLLGRGISVVLDASWIDSSLRDETRKTALATSSDLVQFHFTLPSQEAHSRINYRRTQESPHVSDATPEIATAMARDEHPWKSAVEIGAQEPADKILEKMLLAMTLPGSGRASQNPESAAPQSA